MPAKMNCIENRRNKMSVNFAITKGEMLSSCVIEDFTFSRLIYLAGHV